jgi:hypothetical protein
MQIYWWQLKACIVTPGGCGQCHWCFGGKCCLYLQSQRVNSCVCTGLSLKTPIWGWCLAWAYMDNGMEHWLPAVTLCTLGSLNVLMLSLHNFLGTLSLLALLGHQPPLLPPPPPVYQNINLYTQKVTHPAHFDPEDRGSIDHHESIKSITYYSYVKS